MSLYTDRIGLRYITEKGLYNEIKIMVVYYDILQNNYRIVKQIFDLSNSEACAI
jgi:hypothetical protein